MTTLSAVDIRSWFMKNFEVNIPVLKILDGVTVGELVSFTAARIPARLVPNMCPTTTTEGANSQDVPLSDQIDTAHVFQNGQIRSETSDELRFRPIEKERDSEHDAQREISLYPRPSIQKSYRLSFTQEMFWFLLASLEDKTSLNNTGWARITGNLRPPALQDAVRTIGQHHESLRTCFFIRNGNPIQRVMNSSILRLESRQIQSQEEVS